LDVRTHGHQALVELVHAAESALDAFGELLQRGTVLASFAQGPRSSISSATTSLHWIQLISWI